MHDESECMNLHPEFGYTIRVYKITKGALAFERWYNTIFVHENPRLNDFEFRHDDLEGIEMIEIMQHNPFFNVDSLEQIFQGYQIECLENKPVHLV